MNLRKKTVDQLHIAGLIKYVRNNPNDVEPRQKLWKEIKEYTEKYGEKFPIEYKEDTKGQKNEKNERKNKETQ